MLSTSSTKHSIISHNNLNLIIETTSVQALFVPFAITVLDKRKMSSTRNTFAETSLIGFVIFLDEDVRLNQNWKYDFEFANQRRVTKKRREFFSISILNLTLGQNHSTCKVKSKQNVSQTNELLFRLG